MNTVAAVPCLVLMLAGCTESRRDDAFESADTGRAQFEDYCAACHQYDGRGMGEAPPLDGSPWVTGPEKRLIRIVLHGVRGRIEIRGRVYDREMPGFGQILSDTDVAAVLSFVRERFGRRSGAVTPAAVEQVRAASPHRTDYWRVEELLAEP